MAIEFTQQQKIDLRVKRLEAVQSIIARIASNSTTAKNVAITVAMALAGLGVTARAPSVLLVGFVATVIIAILDAKYLSLERRYRSLHNTICSTPWDDDPDMSVDISIAPPSSWSEAFFSWSILGSYGLLLLIEIIVLLMLMGARYCDV